MRKSLQTFTAFFTKASKFLAPFRSFSSSTSSDKAPETFSLETLKDHRWLEYDPTHKKSAVTHKSLSEQYISEIPVIYVEEDIVRCMGGTAINAGHPQVYIRLKKSGSPSTCKYCGLRFQKKDHHHGGSGHH